MQPYFRIKKYTGMYVESHTIAIENSKKTPTETAIKTVTFFTYVRNIDCDTFKTEQK